MTKLLERALAAVQGLSDESQDKIAHAILWLAEHDREPETIPDDHLPGVLEGLAEAEQGEFASDAEVVQVFRRFTE